MHLRRSYRRHAPRWNARPLCGLGRFAAAPLLAIGVAVGACAALRPAPAPPPPGAFAQAAANGRAASEGFVRSRRYVEAWLTHADPETGLIPRNLDRDRDVWNAQDAAADNYPFMVLTAAMTDRPLFEGRMRDMLRVETERTSRLGRLPDAYAFSRRGFVSDVPVLDDILFGASEYIKDGLLPLTEWLGPSPWSERMIGMLDDMWARAPVETPFGRIVSTSHEVNGEMLQVLSRVYWMTGDERYLDYAVRLGDYYLLGEHHPTRHAARLRLRDHGCEVVSGLTELYATVHYARPAKKQAYRAPLREMLDRILAVGRDAHGLFYNVVDPQRGVPLDSATADTWGYTFNGYYTVHLVDSVAVYRSAVREALGALDRYYRGYDWERGSADGYADAIESALNLYRREPVPGAAAWIDSQMRVMWAMQDSTGREPRWHGSGIVEGWHGDGNFARTSLMYSLWKTQGLTVDPWRPDVVFGAVRDGDDLLVSVSSGQGWTGALVFDRPRHRTDLKLPLDWPRINQFPEWFTVEADAAYTVADGATAATYTGRELQYGIPLRLRPGEERRLIVSRE